MSAFVNQTMACRWTMLGVVGRWWWWSRISILSDDEITATSSDYIIREVDKQNSDDDGSYDRICAETPTIPNISYFRKQIDELLSYFEPPYSDKSFVTSEFGGMLGNGRT